MKIKSAKFKKGIVGPDQLLENDIPQIAFIGRSNVGKSSVINSLTHQKNLAITSSFPGRTRQINLFLINDFIYLLDLPGYGFSQVSPEKKEHIQQLIYWYLLESGYNQRKIVLIIDANVGPTEDDLETLHRLQTEGKNVVIIANKVDKIKKSQQKNELQKINSLMRGVKIIPYSAKKKIGITELNNEILTN